MRAFFILTLGAGLASVSLASPFLLDASDFNVVVRNGFTGLNSDVQGKLAAGGNLSVQNYSIGTGLSGFTGDSVLVGGDFNYNNGQVFNGNVVTADTTPTTSGFTVLNGTFHSGTTPSIYIPTLMTELVARSGFLGSQAANGTTNFSFGSLNLSGGTGTTRIFNVTAAQLSATNNFVINAPSGTTVVVNIDGANASFQNAGFSLTGGVTNDKVMLNFWNATSLSMSGVGIYGTVFAPQAEVNFANGQLNGQLIANSFTGGGEMHIGNFTGTVPVPEPASIAALTVGALSLLRRRRR